MKYYKQEQFLVCIIDDLYNNKTIDDFFYDFHLSKKTIHLLKQDKDYTLNNIWVPSSTILHDGDKLKIKAYKTQTKIESIPYPLTILYEDDILCIVDKPSGIIVHDDGCDPVTLNHYVASYFKQQKQDVMVAPIHRLDKDTSGIIIYVKCSLLQPLFDYMMKEKLFHRHYFAVVKGTFPDQKRHTIKKRIGRDRHHNKKMRISSTGLEAITHYTMLKQNDRIAYVECTLETGRTHQIRVHLSAIDHPILHDPLYGTKDKQRLALHSWKLSFVHPLTKQEISITCPIPEELKLL